VCVRCEFLMEVEVSVWPARCWPGLAGGRAGLARLRFLPSATGFMGLMSVEFFTPSTNPGLLDLMLDNLITSYADTRLDAEPES
jgi:hypothetical protein